MVFLQVGHFFCAFTAALMQGSQNTCLHRSNTCRTPTLAPVLKVEWEPFLLKSLQCSDVCVVRLHANHNITLPARYIPYAPACAELCAVTPSTACTATLSLLTLHLHDAVH